MDRLRCKSICYKAKHCLNPWHFWWQTATISSISMSTIVFEWCLANVWQTSNSKLFKDLNATFHFAFLDVEVIQRVPSAPWRFQAHCLFHLEKACIIKSTNKCYSEWQNRLKQKRGYFWKAINQWLLFDFRQKIINLFILIFSPSKVLMVIQHVKHTVLSCNLSSSHFGAFEVLIFGTVKGRPHQLWPQWGPFHFRPWHETAQLHQRPISLFHRALWWYIISDIFLYFDKKTGGKEIKISIKDVDLARCSWFTPTISAQKTKTKHTKNFFFCFFFTCHSN